MTRSYCKKLIESELHQYDVQPESDAFTVIFENCIEAYDVLNTAEIKQLISDMLEEFPLEARYV